jgi:hypothetical protein
MKKILFIMSLFTTPIFAQEEKVSFALFDGIFIGGYIDNGAFLNFTGPNMNATYKNSKFILGMLPSLRFKEDKGTPKNAFVTPNLGVGFTYSYKKWAIQIPLYYNAKTATDNGRWHIGLGIGFRLYGFNKNNKGYAKVQE